MAALQWVLSPPSTSVSAAGRVWHRVAPGALATLCRARLTPAWGTPQAAAGGANVCRKCAAGADGWVYR